MAVASAAAVAYLPALSQGFVLGDDHNNFVFNPSWRGLGRQQLEWMWTTFHLGHWQPLTWMTFGAEYGLWGMTPGEPYPPEGPRYHLLNLVLHAATAWLVYEIFRRLLRTCGAPVGEGALDSCAAVAAALWAVHPLRVENVAWATERRDMLSISLLAACLLAWLRWKRASTGSWLALSLFFYALSLSSKAWGITLPAVLVLIEVGILERDPARQSAHAWSQAVVRTWPFALLALPVAWLAARAQASVDATLSLADHGLAARAAQAAWGLSFYVRKTLWPSELSTHYMLERDLDPTRPIYLVSFAAVVVALVGAWVLRRRVPSIAVALVSYVALVSPVLGVLQSGLQKAADRYAYLATLPLFALLAGGLAWLTARRPGLGRVGLGLALAALSASGIATWRQTKVWQDSVTLYERAVAVEPDNYIAQMNLATALREVGRGEEAIVHTQRSIASEPGPRNAYARFHLGLLRLQAGDFEGALAAWRETLEVDPAHLLTLDIASHELASHGRAGEGRALLEAALASRPEAGDVRERLAMALWTAGERARAEELWREGLALDERWAAGHEGLGRCSLARQQVAEAERELRRALELDRRRIDARVLLGRVLRSSGRVAEAEAAWLEVLQIAPGHRQASQLLEQSRSAGR
jgi:tetratricopeptide (TPR) repeat protein